MEIELAGERLGLTAARGVVWRRTDTLFVADMHLGKAGYFRRRGIPVPEWPTARDLERLNVLIDGHAIEHLVILGDFYHGPCGDDAALAAEVAAWRDAHRGLRITLVRGNHDRRAGDPAAALGFEVVDEGATMGPFELRHYPDAPDASDAGPTLAGHLHPCIRLPDLGTAMRLPCYHRQKEQLILPAFGSFTGGHPIAPEPGDGVYAISPEGVHDLSRAFAACEFKR